MKKVLSVLLAAAMVMGMSVTSMAKADKIFAANAKNDLDYVHACEIGFSKHMWAVHQDKNLDHKENQVDIAWVEKPFDDMRPGDNLYFPMTWSVLNDWDIETGKWVLVTETDLKVTNPSEYSKDYVGGKFGETHVFKQKGEWVKAGEDTTGGYFAWKWVPATYTTVNYTGAIDKDWSINIKGNEYVVNAYFVAVTPAGYSTKAADLGNESYEKAVCVEIMDELDNLDAQDAIMYMSIVDMDNDCDCAWCNSNNHRVRNCESEEVYMNYSFDNLTYKPVDFKFPNDADGTAKWIVAKDAKGTAVFDFDDDVYFTVKMVSEEEVILNLSTAYDKAIDALFGYDADLSFYNFKGTKDAFTKTGELFIEADEDTFVYEIVDGKIVEIEAEYVEEYKVANTSKAKAGWVIETKELGYYIVSDIEAEIEVEAEVEAPVEADKANPETGAADFVGAAVAMAVVSVAAAGALALKK